MEFARRYRITALALGVSAAVHAAVFVGVPGSLQALDGGGAAYTASLDPAAPEAGSAAPPPTSAPKRARARVRAHALEPLLDPVQPELVAAADPALIEPLPLPAPAPAPAPPAKPEVVAMAAPAAPVPALEPPAFPVAALPANISITYSLTSSFADGRAVYHWSRDGDTYSIRSEAEAIGFFTLFLEGRILQESRGTVTPTGLRPESFTERKPNTAAEGLQFDWAGNKVTFDRNNEKKTEPLEGNTVDWLSMIFQMAHMPPSGESYDLRVYTQRRLYQFHLKILGEEEIEIPLGKVKAIHLQHLDADASQVVDVWLGVAQHYLPVKLRYPVARNRLTVEQVATRVAAH
jgi:hypothetical protein